MVLVREAHRVWCSRRLYVMQPTALVGSVAAGAASAGAASAGAAWAGAAAAGAAAAAGQAAAAGTRNSSTHPTHKGMFSAKEEVPSTTQWT